MNKYQYILLQTLLRFKDVRCSKFYISLACKLSMFGYNLRLRIGVRSSKAFERIDTLVDFDNRIATHFRSVLPLRQLTYMVRNEIFIIHSTT